MRRRITEQLISWKKSLARMPLLLYGARQVGKTHILREFGKQNYVNTVYINFELNSAACSYFSDDLRPQRIIRFLEAETGERITPENTLIIFDEIQVCERALTSLKYFNELAPEYHIVAAGSLLGVALNSEKYSFPVGNVDSYTLFPMDFEEFLWALDEELLCEEIRTSYIKDTPLPAALHKRALEHYRMYLIIGGMPAALQEYIRTGSLIMVPDVQNKLINDYIADMAKYASTAESVQIRAAYNSIPQQLAKDNKKFQYKLVQRGGTATIFGSAIDWLCSAGIVLKCSKVEHGSMPLSVYNDLSSFKLYMSDTGLLVMKSGMPQRSVLAAGDIQNTFIGAVTENYVAQTLAANRYDIYYWENKNTAEIDFVIQKDDSIVPIEVKTGIRTKSRSLHVYTTKYSPEYSIRISSKNFGFENSIKSVPLYAAFCI